MKTIRINICNWLEKQDNSWRALPLERQLRYTLSFFFAYLLLTAGVILKVCCDIAKPDSSMVIEHIDNPAGKKESPVAQRDTISTILKDKIYERK